MDTIKIITLNCHSLEEENYKEKLEEFVTATAGMKPQIIALQEVNQSIDSQTASEDLPEGYCPCEPGIVLKKDNHALNVAEKLRKLGYPMYWTWTPAKKGYDKYEEGLALFSVYPIDRAESTYTTISRDFDNWKVRKAVSVVCTIGGRQIQFISVHMGWWEDREEPFISQWEKLEDIVNKNMNCFVMGDFNSPASMKNGGYDYIISKGWKDTYRLANKKDEGFTVCKKIDGWKDKDSEKNMRIDFIFTNGTDDMTIDSSSVVFNGKNGQVVSDHFGVMIDCSQNNVCGNCEGLEQVHFELKKQKDENSKG